MNIRHRYFNLRDVKKKKASELASTTTISDFGSQPRTLTEPIQVLPQRPKTSRTKKEKDEAIEVLVIEGIKVPHGAAARFDVYVAKPMEGHVGPDVGELVGSFVNLPHARYKFHIKKAQVTP